MSNLSVLLNQINKCYNLNLTQINSASLNHRNILQLDSNIYQKVISKVESDFGGSVLKFSMTPDNYMRYKNGKVSSIIKGDSGFQRHEGFEAVEMVCIVDSIFSEVSQYYTTTILNEFNSLTNNIFSAIQSLHTTAFNQAINLKEQDYIEELASFRDFFDEINNELGDISISTVKCSAYISNIITIRQKVYKVYNYFIGALNNYWPPIITGTDYAGQLINKTIDFNLLNNHYCACRQAISCYMICLVYENIMAGNIGNKSCELITSKLQQFLNRFNIADSTIKNALYQRQSQNWNWYYWDRQQDNNNIAWFLQTCNRDPNFEITKVREIFNRSKLLLEEINLIEGS